MRFVLPAILTRLEVYTKPLLTSKSSMDSGQDVYTFYLLLHITREGESVLLKTPGFGQDFSIEPLYLLTPAMARRWPPLLRAAGFFWRKEG
jgi:hypothetical protein